MRCLGLTAERRRCPVEVLPPDQYCKTHRATRTTASRYDRVPTFVPAALTMLFRFDCGRSHRVPDAARWEVPRWIRSGSTPRVVEQVQNHPNMMVRWHCALVLRQRRDPQTIDPLWSVLTCDLSGLVRQQAAVALGKIGTPHVLGPLVEALIHDADAAVRQACAVALGNLGDAAAAQDLVHALEREPAAFVRWDCVLALASVGDRAHESLLMTIAGTDRAQVVRDACHEALAAIRRRAQAIDADGASKR